MWGQIVGFMAIQWKDLKKKMALGVIENQRGWILAAASAGAKLLKKAKKKKADRAQQNEAKKIAERNLQKAKIAKAGVQARHGQETQTQTSSFAGRGVAGGPAAAAGVRAREGQQGREMAEANIDIDAAQTALNTQKTIKKSKKGILGWL